MEAPLLSHCKFPVYVTESKEKIFDECNCQKCGWIKEILVTTLPDNLTDQETRQAMIERWYEYVVNGNAFKVNMLLNETILDDGQRATCVMIANDVYPIATKKQEVILKLGYAMGGKEHLHLLFLMIQDVGHPLDALKTTKNWPQVLDYYSPKYASKFMIEMASYVSDPTISNLHPTDHKLVKQNMERLLIEKNNHEKNPNFKVPTLTKKQQEKGLRASEASENMRDAQSLVGHVPLDLAMALLQWVETGDVKAKASIDAMMSVIKEFSGARNHGKEYKLRQQQALCVIKDMERRFIGGKMPPDDFFMHLDNFVNHANYDSMKKAISMVQSVPIPKKDAMQVEEPKSPFSFPESKTKPTNNSALSWDRTFDPSTLPNYAPPHLVTTPDKPTKKDNEEKPFLQAGSVNDEINFTMCYVPHRNPCPAGCGCITCIEQGPKK